MLANTSDVFINGNQN